MHADWLPNKKVIRAILNQKSSKIDFNQSGTPLIKNGCSKLLTELKTFNFDCKAAQLLFILYFVAQLDRFCHKCNSLSKAKMISTRKKRQQNKRLLIQSDDFDQDVFSGDAANSGQQCVVVTDGTVD